MEGEGAMILGGDVFGVAHAGEDMLAERRQAVNVGVEGIGERAKGLRQGGGLALEALLAGVRGAKEFRVCKVFLRTAVRENLLLQGQQCVLRLL